jgi:hypothetical protein
MNIKTPLILTFSLKGRRDTEMNIPSGIPSPNLGEGKGEGYLMGEGLS